MTNKLTILNSFTMPAEDETFEVTVSDTKSLTPNCWLWNESVGYLEVVKYSAYDIAITVKNLGRRENAKRGTEFPTCMEFLITAPTALDPYNPLSTCLAADFNSPTVDNEAYMSVGSTYVIKVDDQIIVDGDYRYAVTQIVNATTLKVRNEGLGKEGIIEVGCDSCVPVQVVSKLNCCPIPSGDLTSNTSVLTVNNGYDVLLDNASLTLDTDLSKYDNSSSEFITLNDVPRGTLNSSSNIIGVSGGVNNVLGNITLSLDTDLSKYNNSNSEFITVDDIPRGEIYSSTNVLTVNNGSNNVLGNIELSLDKDLSKYNNTTSAFITLSDIPRGSLTSTTQLISITGGTNNVLSNISMTLDTDLSKYDNTTSGFLTPADKKNLTSNTSVLTVMDGTGATLENTILELDTDLSKYDNSTSGFITSVDGSNLTSNSSLLTINNGTGTTLKNTSISLNTDLSLYDNSNSNFLSASSLPTIGDGVLTIQQDGQMVGSFSANSISDVTIDIPSGEGAIYTQNVTNYTLITNVMRNPYGAISTSSLMDDSINNVAPQRLGVVSGTPGTLSYINSPLLGQGTFYSTYISNTSPTLSPDLGVTSGINILLGTGNSGYYYLHLIYNEYEIKYRPYSEIEHAATICFGYTSVNHTTSSNINYKPYSPSVDTYEIIDSTTGGKSIFVIFSVMLRFSSSTSYGLYSCVKALSFNTLDHSYSPEHIDFRQTWYSPSSIPSSTNTTPIATSVAIISNPFASDGKPAFIFRGAYTTTYTTNTHIWRCYWDNNYTQYTTNFPSFLNTNTTTSVMVSPVIVRCESNTNNITFVACYSTYLSGNTTFYLTAYTDDFTEVWSNTYNVNTHFSYVQRLASLAIDGEDLYYAYAADITTIRLIKLDLLTGTVLSQPQEMSTREVPYSFYTYADTYYNVSGDAPAKYIKDICMYSVKKYLLISTVWVDSASITTSSDVTYYWSVTRVEKDPETIAVYVSDKDLISSSSTGSLGTTLYPWDTGNITNINTNIVTFSSNQNISTTNATTIAINTNSKSYTFGSGTGGAVAGSDEILKKNVITMPDGALEIINELRPVKFDFVSDTVDASYYAGFIAQETDNIVPNLTVPPAQDDKNPVYGIDYAGFVPYLVKAIQELYNKVIKLEERLKKIGI